MLGHEPTSSPGFPLSQAARIDMLDVGCKGSTPALQDLIGGHVPLTFDGMAASVPLIQGGKMEAYAVSTPRWPVLAAAVPTWATRSSRRWPGWAFGPSQRPTRQ
ncbi:MAG: hypothetical protein KIT17_12480 [Rubrivivax sp.]|nr:hypothetical protein [Rubrivivax sp.]